MRPTAVRLFAIVGAMAVVLAGGEVALAAAITKGSLPSATSSAVGTLISRESAVITALKQFEQMGKSSQVGSWEQQLTTVRIHRAAQ